MKYQINNNDFQIEVKGERSFGKDAVLFLEDDNLIAHTLWQQAGFSLISLLPPAEFDLLNTGLKQYLIYIIGKYVSNLPADFTIPKYHQITQNNQPLHIAITNEAKQVDYRNFPVPISTIIERVEDEVKIPLTVLNPNTQE